MEIISMIENTRLKKRKDLHKEHGLSFSIKSEDFHLLFDTGSTGNFCANGKKLDIDSSKITHLIISHHHVDHGGGISTFLEVNQNAKIFLRKSHTEKLNLDIFGLIKRPVGLDDTIFELNPQRFVFIDQFCEIAPNVFILTDIPKIHPMPIGNRHLYMDELASKKPDDFSHELIMVVKQNNGLVVFTGCSHHGILNMIDAVLNHFHGLPIRAVFGGFHLIDIPLINSMAGNKADVEILGKAILNYPIEKVYTGHCTGLKAYKILKKVMGQKLEYFSTGCRVEM